MLTNYLKLSLRNLLRNKLFSLINIGGLAGGIVISLVLFLYIDYERDFDSFQSKEADIYRLLSHSTLGDTPETWGSSPNIAGPTFKADIPEIKEQVRLIRHNFGDPANVKANDRVFFENDLFWTDPSVTNMFDFSFVKGDKTSFLKHPNTIAINESTAKKYFGDKDPIGQVLKIDNDLSCEVSAVFRDLPHNSSVRPAIMGSIASIEWMVKSNEWSNASFETYLLLEKGVDYKAVEKKIIADANQKKPARSNWINFSLQPFSEIHLSSAHIQNTYVDNTGDKNSVQIVSILAIVILLIAAINYMNLATARSQKRFKEVGICKTLGADKKELIKRFYIETALLVGISVVAALLLLIPILPYFNYITASELTMARLLNPKIIVAILISVTAIILISGAYPAIYLSSFNPKDLFNTSFRNDKFAGMLRQGLVVIQFSVSIVLIFSTIIFYRQLRFIQTTDLGFKPEQVLCINTSGAETRKQLDGLMNDLKSMNYVSAVSRTQTFPGKDGSLRVIYKPQHPENYKNVTTCRASSDIVNAMGLKLLAGKTLGAEGGEQDSTYQLVLNRTAISFLGYTPEEAIGKKVSVFTNADEIVGVVEDFHFQSLHEPIGAYAFHNAPRETRPYMLIRMTMDQDMARLKAVKTVFSKNLPDAAFDYLFLDQHLKSLYRKESQTVNITLLFSGLAILLACLGLFGLSAYMIELKVKEIGVRKVLGASLLDIVRLISKKFILQVFLSGLIALPLAWMLMNNWLNHFAFHISIGWTVFMITLGIALLTAFLTISFQALKAAKAKPVNSLRTE